MTIVATPSGIRTLIANKLMMKCAKNKVDNSVLVLCSGAVLTSLLGLTVEIGIKLLLSSSHIDGTIEAEC